MLAVKIGQVLLCSVTSVFASQPGCFCQIDPESVASSLIASGHLGAGVAELLLDVALVDLGRGGEAGAQRVAGEKGRALGLGQVAAQAGGGGGALDQALSLIHI